MQRLAFRKFGMPLVSRKSLAKPSASMGWHVDTDVQIGFKIMILASLWSSTRINDNEYFRIWRGKMCWSFNFL